MLAGTDPVKRTWFRKKPEACETIVIPEPLALTVLLPDCVGGAGTVLVFAPDCIPAPPDGPAAGAARPRVGAASAAMLALRAETT